jgi:ribosome-binding protein aMBF1 (putative translation factor)
MFYFIFIMSHQDWNVVTLHKTPSKKAKTGTASTVPKSHLNSQTSNIKVQTVWDSKDEEDPIVRPVTIGQEFAHQMQQARMNKGMTQKELANAICVPQSVINEYERGVGVHNSSYVSKIKKHLGITKHTK